MEEEKELSKGQKYIAKQAKPEDEIDADDFKMSRSKKKRDMKESEDMDFYKDSDIMGGEVHSNRSKGDMDEEMMYELEIEKELDEADVWEGNEFSGELAKARERGDDYLLWTIENIKLETKVLKNSLKKIQIEWRKKGPKVILENGVKDRT